MACMLPYVCKRIRVFKCWGAVVTGVGFFMIVICILLCVHSYLVSAHQTRVEREINAMQTNMRRLRRHRDQQQQQQKTGRLPPPPKYKTLNSSNHTSNNNFNNHNNNSFTNDDQDEGDSPFLEITRNNNNDDDNNNTNNDSSNKLSPFKHDRTKYPRFGNVSIDISSPHIPGPPVCMDTKFSQSKHSADVIINVPTANQINSSSVTKNISQSPAELLFNEGCTKLSITRNFGTSTITVTPLLHRNYLEVIISFYKIISIKNVIQPFTNEFRLLIWKYQQQIRKMFLLPEQFIATQSFSSSILTPECIFMDEIIAPLSCKNNYSGHISPTSPLPTTTTTTTTTTTFQKALTTLTPPIKILPMNCVTTANNNSIRENRDVPISSSSLSHPIRISDDLTDSNINNILDMTDSKATVYENVQYYNM
ncbi:hypothetical protein HELRODRAFT_161997 [Helobdella robusta]|uniref:Uncharacterized protein n=1 Tax=Helobdella robusta TaxID=6412 RepID=T1ES49_HELRO|nr:hypothetical protein HELRODRAFT_161997 [Helobdella robusta]ESO02703.1 hypothetical protein HELRODRAFT_161997 [Helobdella robusta]